MSERSHLRGSVSRQLLTDRVYDQLMLELIEGRLAADEQINIDSLARDLEISQTPIREALARMEATGLVVRTALKGYRVAPLFSARELSELMDARLVLEPELAYLACGHLTALIVAGLEEANRGLDHSDAGDLGPFWQLDEHFHRLIAEAADNRFLLTAYSSLGGHVQRFRLFGGLEVKDARLAVAEHAKILDAFHRSDAAAARAAMAEHIENVRARAVSETEDR